MQTRRDWRTIKKKHAIPSGAAKGIDFGKQLDKCAKVVNGKKKPADVLRAIGVFRPILVKYRAGLLRSDQKAFNKATVFFRGLVSEMDSAEDVAESGDGMVVNIQPEKAGAKKQTINEAAKNIASRRSHGKDSRTYASTQDPKSHKDAKVKGKDKVDFGDAGLKGPIVILAHGRPMGNAKVPGKVHATRFGSKKASGIVSYLAKTLPLTYYGVVYLDGCYTAAGGSPNNFLLQVYKGLVKKGYLYLQLKGNLGVAATTIDGKEIVTWPELEKEKKKLQVNEKKVRAAISKVVAPYDKERQEASKKLPALIKQAKAEGKDAKKLVDEFAAKFEQKQARDPKLKELREALEKIKKKLADTTIEEFVGTIGPEKRRPR